jgi:hypothetical protein
MMMQVMPASPSEAVIAEAREHAKGAGGDIAECSAALTAVVSLFACTPFSSDGGMAETGQCGGFDIRFSIAASSQIERQIQNHTRIRYLPVSLWF